MTNHEWLKSLTVKDAIHELSVYSMKTLAWRYTITQAEFLFEFLIWLNVERNEDE